MTLIYTLDPPSRSEIHQLGIAELSAAPVGQNLGFVILAADGLEEVRFAGPIVCAAVKLDDLFEADKEWQTETWRLANLAADQGVQHLMLGAHVAVVCWMGLNRSGLVAGVMLRKLGLTGEQAVARIKSWRGVVQGLEALHNQLFVKMLCERELLS